MLNEPEKRESPRISWIVETGGRVLPPLEESGQPPLTISGITENISKGGVGLTSDSRLPTNVILRCEFLIPSTSIAIPTLLQVLWSERLSTDQTNQVYRYGLKFLF